MINGIDDAEWSSLQATCLETVVGRSLRGRSKARTLLVEGDASWQYAVAPVLAWVQELWRRMHGDAAALDWKALARAWDAGRRRDVTSWPNVRGPVDAARLSLHRLQWSWPTPWTFEADNGVEVDLLTTSPQMLKALLMDAGRRRLEREVGDRMRRAGWGGCGDEVRGGCAISAAAVQRTLIGKDLADDSSHCVRAAATGATWTAAQLADAGYLVDRRCGLCKQADDTMHHRLWQCSATADLRKDKALERTCKRARAWAEQRHPVYHAGLLPMEAQPPPAEDDPLDELTPEARARAAESHTFYVDGSCSTELLTSARRAAWAVIGLRAGARPDDDPKLAAAWSISGPVPRWLPQTAQAAEHVAALLAGHLADDPGRRSRPRIVGDCAGVVAGCRRTDWTVQLGSRQFYGGIWKQVAELGPAGRAALRAMDKVAAHRTEAQKRAATEAELLDYIGNEAADHAAKEARRRHPCSSNWVADSQAALVQDALATTRLMRDALPRWPRLPRAGRPVRGTEAEREAVRLARAQRRAEARSARASQRHAALRSAHASHAWQCWQGGAERCARCLRRRTRTVGHCSVDQLARPLLELAAAASDLDHDLWAAALVEHGPTGGEAPLAICRLCGGWTRGWRRFKGQLLTQGCTGTRRLAGAQAWNRVLRGMHPTGGAVGATARVVAAAPWDPADLHAALAAVGPSQEEADATAAHDGSGSGFGGGRAALEAGAVSAEEDEASSFEATRGAVGEHSAPTTSADDGRAGSGCAGPSQPPPGTAARLANDRPP